MSVKDDERATAEFLKQEAERIAAAKRVWCRDGCGAFAVDATTAQSLGWNQGEITARFRCGACARALDAANGRTRPVAG